MPFHPPSPPAEPAAMPATGKRRRCGNCTIRCRNRWADVHRLVKHGTSSVRLGCGVCGCTVFQWIGAQ